MVELVTLLTNYPDQPSFWLSENTSKLLGAEFLSSTTITKVFESKKLKCNGIDKKFNEQ